MPNPGSTNITNQLKALHHERIARTRPTISTINLPQTPFTVTVSEIHGAQLGSTLWQASVPLCQTLARDIHKVQGRNVVELGCGLGTAGIAAAILGARRVVLTDKAETLCHAIRNVQVNSGSCGGSDQLLSDVVECQELLWGCDDQSISDIISSLDCGHHKHVDEEKHEVDLVLASDCCYERELLSPFFSTVSKLCSKNTMALISFCKRGGCTFEDVRFAIAEAGLQVVSTERISTAKQTCARQRITMNGKVYGGEVNSSCPVLDTTVATLLELRVRH